MLIRAARLTAIFLISVMTASCATSYGRSSPLLPYGYSDTHIKDNLYYVEFKANMNSGSALAAQYFHRRAKEVCLENGYKDYRVKDERDTSGAYAVGSVGAGTISAGAHRTPGFAGYVECMK